MKKVQRTLAAALAAMMLMALAGCSKGDVTKEVNSGLSDLKAQADGFAFDNALDTAILGKKGRSVKAVRALLDVDSLKGSADRTADIAKALDEAAKANPWAFGEDGGVGRVDTGAAHGTPPTNDTDGVEAAFKAMNPELKL